MTARKSADVLRLTGSASHNPARLRRREHEPAAIGAPGPPPEHLPAAAKAAWAEIVADATPGTIGRADRMILEAAAAQIALARGRGWDLTPPALLRVEQMLGRLGLSPVDRHRVTEGPATPQKRPNNRFFSD